MADKVQTYILKVNIGCCNACPKTLKKLLHKNKGVEKFDVDQEKSIVSVTGKLDLYQLIKDIKKKMKKNAELIKKESSDPEDKQEKEKEKTDSANKEESQEPMAPPEQVIEDTGIHQNMYSPFMQQMPRYHCQCMMCMMPPPPPPPPRPFGFYFH